MVTPELSQSDEALEPDVERGVTRLEELGHRFLDATTRHLRSWIWEQTEEIIDADPQRVVDLGPRRLRRLRKRVGRLDRKLPSIVEHKIGSDTMWVRHAPRRKSRRVWWLLDAALVVVGLVLLPLGVDVAVALAFFAAAILMATAVLTISLRRRGSGDDDVRAVTAWWVSPKNASRPIPRAFEQRLRAMASRLGRIHRRAGLGRRRWTRSPTQSGVLLYWEPIEPSDEMREALTAYREAAGELHALLTAHVDEEAQRIQREAESLWQATAPGPEQVDPEADPVEDDETASD